MNVNFNNLRLQTIVAFDKLTQILNDGILEDNLHTCGNSGDLLINVQDIQEHMDRLRQNLLFIGACHEPGDEDFKDISEEIDYNNISSFNPSEDE